MSLKKINKILLPELSKLPKFKADEDWKLPYFECRSFYGRWRYEEVQDRVKIEFAQKKTFDRWANSTNFQITLYCRSNEPFTVYFNLLKCHLWMEKVCRSKLFDFNRYFSAIEVWI